MNKLTIWFTSDVSISAYRTEFKRAESRQTYSTTRGKMAGPFMGHGTFQWTNGVKALCALLLCTKCFTPTPDERPFILEGHTNSLASSLDYSIAKETLWLSDMFGIEGLGRPFAKKLFLRANSHLRLPGPVCIAINPFHLAVNNIHIFLDGQSVTKTTQLLEMISLLGPDLNIPSHLQLELAA